MSFIDTFFSQFTELSEKSLNDFKNLISLKFLKKGDIICDIGEIPTNFFIIKSGIVRSYYYTESGKDYTVTFSVPPNTSGSLSSLITKTKSDLVYCCLTDCEMYYGNYHQFIKLCQSNNNLYYMYGKVLEKSFMRMEYRIIELATLSSTERFLKLKKNIPEIENLIPQYQIASYLNITPIQLSRIRKKLLIK